MDDTLLSRIADLERENAELRKTSKADIDRRAEQLGMRCKTCLYRSQDDKGVCTKGAFPRTRRMSVKGTHYCKWWSHK